MAQVFYYRHHGRLPAATTSSGVVSFVLWMLVAVLSRIVLFTDASLATTLSTTINNNANGVIFIPTGDDAAAAGDAPLNITRIAGQTVMLHCGFASNNDGALQIEWSRGPRTILPENHRQYVFPNGTLVLKTVEPSLDNGWYKCRTALKAPENGAKTAAVDFYFHAANPPAIDDFTFPHDLSPNSRVRISCIVSKGDGPMQIQWLKDGNDLERHPVDGVATQAIDQYTSFLSISRLQSEHAGNYTCLASNGLSHDAHTSRLVVNVPPFWTFEPQSSTTILMHENLWIDCQAGGTPSPVIMWKRSFNGRSGGGTSADGSPQDNYTSVTGMPNAEVFANGTLFLRDIRRSDDGQYLCQADNGIRPLITKLAHISVRAPAYFEKTSAEANQVENVTARVGRSAQLSCQAYGDAPLMLDWKFEGQSLNNSSGGGANAVRRQIEADARPDGIESRLKFHSARRLDSGLYECHASNRYGNAVKQLRLLVQEPPEPPEALAVVAHNSRMVTVEWHSGFDGNSAITTYIVEYKRPNMPWSANAYVMRATVVVGADGGSAAAQVPPSSSGPASTSSSSYTLKSLSPSSRYDIRVLAVNALGESGPSQLVQVLTDEEAPSAPPRDVRAQALTSDTVQVVWRPPRADQQNGVLTSYTIGYRLLKHPNASFLFETLPLANGAADSYHTTDAGGSDASFGSTEQPQRIVLKNLRKFAEYEVFVQAENAIGHSPASESVVVHTKEDVPSKQPQDVTVTPLSAQSLRVGWRAPPADSINGVLKGYRVLILPAGRAGPTRTETTATSNDDSGSSIVLDGLEKFTNYSVKVLAFTRVGDGVMSAAVYGQTHEDVPEEPAAVKAVASGPTSVLVTWLPPLQPNGVLRHYTIYMQFRDEKSMNYINGRFTEPHQRTVNKVVQASQNQYLFTELNPNTQYTFYVTAATSVGEGAPTKTIDATPTAQASAKIASFSFPILAATGSDALIPCAAVGYPQPRLEWLKSDGRSIASEHHGHHSQQQQQPTLTYHHTFSRYTIHPNGSLAIRNIAPHDADYYVCRASNLYGTDSMKIMLKVLVAPQPPALHVVGSSNSHLIVGWQAPADDGGSDVLGYTLFYRSENELWKPVRLGPEHTNYTLTQLPCGRLYHFYITAYNSIGTSANSPIAAAGTRGHVPRAPPLRRFLQANTTFIAMQLEEWRSDECPTKQFTIKYKVYADSTFANEAVTTVNDAKTGALLAFGGSGVVLKSSGATTVQPSSINTVREWEKVYRNVAGDVPQFVISELRPGVLYKFDVAAENDAGTTRQQYLQSTLTESGQIVLLTSPNEPSLIGSDSDAAGYDEYGLPMRSSSSSEPSRNRSTSTLGRFGAVLGILLAAVCVVVLGAYAFYVWHQKREVREAIRKSSMLDNVRHDLHTPVPIHNHHQHHHHQGSHSGASSSKLFESPSKLFRQANLESLMAMARGGGSDESEAEQYGTTAGGQQHYQTTAHSMYGGMNMDQTMQTPIANNNNRYRVASAAAVSAPHGTATIHNNNSIYGNCAMSGGTMPRAWRPPALPLILLQQQQQQIGSPQQNENSNSDSDSIYAKPSAAAAAALAVAMLGGRQQQMQHLQRNTSSTTTGQSMEMTNLSASTTMPRNLHGHHLTATATAATIMNKRESFHELKKPVDNNDPLRTNESTPDSGFGSNSKRLAPSSYESFTNSNTAAVVTTSGGTLGRKQLRQQQQQQQKSPNAYYPQQQQAVAQTMMVVNEIRNLSPAVKEAAVCETTTSCSSSDELPNSSATSSEIDERKKLNSKTSSGGSTRKQNSLDGGYGSHASYQPYGAAAAAAAALEIAKGGARPKPPARRRPPSNLRSNSSSASKQAGAGAGVTRRTSRSSSSSLTRRAAASKPPQHHHQHQHQHSESVPTSGPQLHFPPPPPPDVIDTNGSELSASSAYQYLQQQPAAHIAGNSPYDNLLSKAKAQQYFQHKHQHSTNLDEDYAELDALMIAQPQQQQHGRTPSNNSNNNNLNRFRLSTQNLPPNMYLHSTQQSQGFFNPWQANVEARTAVEYGLQQQQQQPTANQRCDGEPSAAKQQQAYQGAVSAV